jgi:hypothetical protein
MSRALPRIFLLREDACCPLLLEEAVCLLAVAQDAGYTARSATGPSKSGLCRIYERRNRPLMYLVVQFLEVYLREQSWSRHLPLQQLQLFLPCLIRMA